MFTIPPDNREYSRDIFLFFSSKSYAVGTHLKCLAKALLMNTHNICFYGEIRKKISVLFR